MRTVSLLELLSVVNDRKMGEKIGVPSLTVYRWRHGLWTPNSDNMKKICRFFRLELEQVTL